MSVENMHCIVENPQNERQKSFKIQLSSSSSKIFGSPGSSGEEEQGQTVHRSEFINKEWKSDTDKMNNYQKYK